MRSSKKFYDAPLAMVFRDYVARGGNDESPACAILWALYCYEFAYLINKEVNGDVPKDFPYWDTTMSESLYFDNTILSDAPELFKGERSKNPKLKFVWKDASNNIFSKRIRQAIHYYGFPDGMMLVRKDFEPIYLDFSLVPAAYEQAKINKANR